MAAEKEIQGNWRVLFRRVGDDYEKDVRTYDVSGRQHTEWRKIKRETIIDDHGKEFLRTIQAFDGAVVVPSHTDYQPIIDQCINRYHPIDVIPKEGVFPTWETLIRRVFGEQELQGWEYLANLYKKPRQILPVLCLVSPENGTGKTSFANGLSILFGQNIGFFGQADLSSQFNTWLRSLVAIFEEINETGTTLNKIKSASTARTVTVNAKYQQQVSFQPFVKLVICSNNDKSFIKANGNDIRYWIRKMKPIPSDEFDPDFEEKLNLEAPAVLCHLAQIPLRKTRSRMFFAPEEIRTDALRSVVKESRSKCAKDLEIMIQEKTDEFKSWQATLTDISEMMGKRYAVSDLKNALKDELGLKPSENPIRYTHISGNSRTGRVYSFGVDNVVNSDSLPF